MNGNEPREAHSSGPPPSRSWILAGCASSTRPRPSVSTSGGPRGYDAGKKIKGRKRHACLEVEAVEAFDGGEPSLPDPPLDHPAFAVDQFQFSEADEIAHMVGALGGALAGNSNEEAGSKHIQTRTHSDGGTRWIVEWL